MKKPANSNQEQQEQPPPIPEAARLASPALANSPVTNGPPSNPDLLNHVQDPPRPREEETGDQDSSSGHEPVKAKEDPPEGGGPKIGEAAEAETRSKIEIMRARQKQMEEENLKKKRILAQAIAERYFCSLGMSWEGWIKTHLKTKMLGLGVRISGK